MTTQDRDRLKVLHEVKKKHITQKEAAEQLGLSRRWVKKLMKRLRKEGDRGVQHRLRGKASNRKIALKVQPRAVKIVRAEYSDFGPTLATEYLAEQHDIAVGKETLRQWMIEDGIWKPKLAKVEQSTRMETAKELPGRVGAVGHQRARLAGRARGEVVSDRHGR